MVLRRTKEPLQCCGMAVLRICWGNLPNKPMVPTAPTAPVVNPPRPLRRHIGQPLDSLGGWRSTVPNGACDAGR